MRKQRDRNAGLVVLTARASSAFVSHFLIGSRAVFLGVQRQMLQHRARRPRAPGLLGDRLRQLADDRAHLPKDVQRVTRDRLVSQFRPHLHFASGPSGSQGDGLAEFVVHECKTSPTTRGRQPFLFLLLLYVRGRTVTEETPRLGRAHSAASPSREGGWKRRPMPQAGAPFAQSIILATSHVGLGWTDWDHLR